MNLNLFKKKRYDCFIIWGHGQMYLDEILDDIRHHESFEIVQIKKHKVKNIKKLVHKIYAFDYAPLFHLKAKVKYLESTPSTVFFIFIKNLDVEEEYFGNGDFRHKECLKIKKFKDQIRVKFNPRMSSGKLTHNHVIHATDNEYQTDSMLKLLGYKQGVLLFKNNNKVIRTPYYIDEPDLFTIGKISFDDLYCANVVEKEGKQLIQQILVLESIQYQALDNPKLYKDYIALFTGSALKQDYNINKYLLLKENFIYLSNLFRADFIVVKKTKNKNKYLIVDGLHRAAIHRHQGNLDITVCVI